MEILILIINGVIWGVATQVVIYHKGYEENGFWWGFFFGLIAFIVACVRPREMDYTEFNSYMNYQKSLSEAADQAQNEKTLLEGGWTCACGNVHAAYVSSCSCGANKREALTGQDKQQKDPANTNEQSNISAIKEYKELMDSGVITPEEFEVKKKQLLGL